MILGGEIKEDFKMLEYNPPFSITNVVRLFYAWIDDCKIFTMNFLMAYKFSYSVKIKSSYKKFYFCIMKLGSTTPLLDEKWKFIY